MQTEAAKAAKRRYYERNKALVMAGENQVKSQRVPLEYLPPEQKKIYIGTVTDMFKHKKISSKKYQYLLLPDLVSAPSIQLLEEWKSRNLNDTRYITKYLVKYLQENLLYDSTKAKTVYGIKGNITSKFRRLWLNTSTWGAEEKARHTTQLHHAVDAIVIANLTPAFVEIATDTMRLQEIFKRSGKRETAEYFEYLDACVRRMKRIYGFTEEYTRAFLHHKNRIPSFVPRIRDEVDILMNDTDEDLLRKQAMAFYSDKKFAETIKMPLVSYKPERRFRGAVSSENPIRVKNIDGVFYQISRKSILELTRKDLGKVISKDKELKDLLFSVLHDKEDKYKIADYVKENNISSIFGASRIHVHKVSLLGNAIDDVFRKQTAEDNFTALDVRNYYCIEVYYDANNKLCTRGIRFVDLAKQNKKLYLAAANPEGYKQHAVFVKIVVA